MKKGDEVKARPAWKKSWPAVRGGATLGNEVGVAAVEFALVLPLLLLMLVGTIELGRVAYFSIEVTSAARAGAQYGSQSAADAADTAGIVQAALNDGQDVPHLSATPTQFCQCSTGASAPHCASTDCIGSNLIKYVQVNTSANISPLLSYPGIPSSFNLSGQAIMPVVQ